MERLSKIGNVEFSATTSEDITYENEVTDRPVENLDYISDHVKQKPVTFTISGAIVGENAFSKLKILRAYLQGKQVYRYIGRNIMSNVVIQSLSTSHNKEIRNGFSFTMQCKIIKMAKSKIVKLQGIDPVKKKQVQSSKGNSNTSKVSKKSTAPTKTQTTKPISKGKVVNEVKQTDSQKAESFRKVSVKQESFMNIRYTTYTGVIQKNVNTANKEKTNTKRGNIRGGNGRAGSY